MKVINKNYYLYQIIDIPKYNGAGVYSLLDDDGKRYIGSSFHIRSRIKQHNTYMRLAIRDGYSGFLNSKMTNALLCGKNFKCEILVKIYREITKQELEEIERIFLMHYGGIDNTYNGIPLRHKINVTTETIDKLCKALQCQPGDILEYVDD